MLSSLPSLPPKALRLLSKPSQTLYFDQTEHFPDAECNEHLLVCLLVISQAYGAGRLTLKEKNSLKSSLSCWGDSLVLPEQLLPAEQETLVSFVESYQSLTVTTCTGMKKGGLVMCCVCLESKDPATIDSGIWCANQVDPHFTCFLCLESYVQTRSSHNAAAEIASLKARSGQILCPMASDLSAPNVHLTCDALPYPTQELAIVLPSACNIPFNTSYLDTSYLISILYQHPLSTHPVKHILFPTLLSHRLCRLYGGLGSVYRCSRL